MLPFFNQKELVVCSNQSQYQKYTSLLEKEGIGYRTKVRDLSSPSLFSMGTRERAGTAFQKVNYQSLYGKQLEVDFARSDIEPLLDAYLDYYPKQFRYLLKERVMTVLLAQKKKLF